MSRACSDSNCKLGSPRTAPAGNGAKSLGLRLTTASGIGCYLALVQVKECQPLGARGLYTNLDCAAPTSIGFPAITWADAQTKSPGPSYKRMHVSRTPPVYSEITSPYTAVYEKGLLSYTAVYEDAKNEKTEKGLALGHPSQKRRICN
eukprot:3941087-Rhodomonas_salina.2